MSKLMRFVGSMVLKTPEVLTFPKSNGVRS